jgi:hypothetical protein
MVLLMALEKVIEVDMMDNNAKAEMDELHKAEADQGEEVCEVEESDESDAEEDDGPPRTNGAKKDAEVDYLDLKVKELEMRKRKLAKVQAALDEGILAIKRMRKLLTGS